MEERMLTHEHTTILKETACQLHLRRRIKTVLLPQDLVRTDMLLLQSHHLRGLLLLHCPCQHIIDLEVLLHLHTPEVVVVIVVVAVQCPQEIILHVIILLEVAMLLHMVVAVVRLMIDHLPEKDIHRERATTLAVLLPDPVHENIQAAVVAVHLDLQHHLCSALRIAPLQHTLEPNVSIHI